MKRSLAVSATVLALAFAGCGGDDEPGELSGPATVVPADMPVYIEASVTPEGTQAENLDALLGELSDVPVLGSVGDPADIIKSELDSAAAQAGVDFSYDEDVAPWIGEKIGFGFTEGDESETRFVAALEAEDEDAAKEALDRILASDDTENPEVEYEGVTYFTTPDEAFGIGVFDGFLVMATKDDFEAAIDASEGESIAESEGLANTFGALDDERLGAAYFDFGLLAELSAGEDGAEDLEAFREIAPEYLDGGIALSAGLTAGDQVYFDYVTPKLEGQPATASSPLLGEAPDDSLGALAASDLGAFGPFVADIFDRAEESGADLGEEFPEGGLSQAFEDEVGVPFDDAMAAIGDGSLYVRGDLPDDIELGGQIEVSDPETAEAIIGAIEDEISKSDNVELGPPVGGSDIGFSVLQKGAPVASPLPIEPVEPGEPVKPIDPIDPGVYDTQPALPFTNVEFDGERVTYGYFKDEEAAEASDAAEQGAFGDTEAFATAEEALGDDFQTLGAVDLGPILDEYVGSASIDDVIGGSPEQAIQGFLADKLGIVAIGIKETEDYSTQRYVLKLAD